jgi:hypothetical protein
MASRASLDGRGFSRVSSLGSDGKGRARMSYPADSKVKMPFKSTDDASAQPGTESGMQFGRVASVIFFGNPEFVHSSAASLSSADAVLFQRSYALPFHTFHALLIVVSQLPLWRPGPRPNHKDCSRGDRSQGQGQGKPAGICSGCTVHSTHSTRFVSRRCEMVAKAILQSSTDASVVTDRAQKWKKRLRVRNSASKSCSSSVASMMPPALWSRSFSRPFLQRSCRIKYPKSSMNLTPIIAAALISTLPLVWLCSIAG